MHCDKDRKRRTARTVTATTDGNHQLSLLPFFEPNHHLSTERRVTDSSTMTAPPAAAPGKKGGTAAPSRPSQLTAAPNAPDPFALLDSLAAQRASSSSSSSSSAFDPVDFLNQHYRTEALLTAQLPRLRDAVSQRIDHLDDQIAQTLIRQSETAASTRQHIQDATAAIQTLEQKIRLVQEKAAQSEKAVLSITADMKVLDHVKTHLQRCITTLKRLHMLVHATEELRQTSLVGDGFCDYGKASQLVQAIRLLLTHFAVTQQQRVLPSRMACPLPSSMDLESWRLVRPRRNFWKNPSWEASLKHQKSNPRRPKTRTTCPRKRRRFSCRNGSCRGELNSWKP